MMVKQWQSHYFYACNLYTLFNRKKYLMTYPKVNIIPFAKLNKKYMNVPRWNGISYKI